MRQRNHRGLAPYEMSHQQPVSISRTVVDGRLTKKGQTDGDDDDYEDADAIIKRTMIVIDASDSMNDNIDSIKKYVSGFIKNIWEIIERHGQNP